MGGLTASEWRQFHYCFGAQNEKECWPKVFVSTRGMGNMRVPMTIIKRLIAKGDSPPASRCGWGLGPGFYSQHSKLLRYKVLSEMFVSRSEPGWPSGKAVGW